MEPTLVVIGISSRGTALAVRERFILDAQQRAQALEQLVRCDGVDEVIVVSTCNRTEFYVWTQDAGSAANSVLRYLTRASNLRLAEWSSFYRIVGDAAISHVLRVASGVESSLCGYSDPCSCVLGAWQQAQRANTTGRFLDVLMTKAMAVAGRIKSEVSAIGNTMSVAQSCVKLCRDSIGDLKDRRVVVLGAGSMALSAVQELKAAHAGEITIVNRTYEHALQLAKQCKVRAGHIETLWEHVLAADIVISAAAHRTFISAEELSVLLKERKKQGIVVIDTAVPRTIDPSVRQLPSVSAFDLDDLTQMAEADPARMRAIPAAQRIIDAEVGGFLKGLLSEAVIPTISALRRRLEHICREELVQLDEQFGPFTEDQRAALETLSSLITQRIAATLARQMKDQRGRLDHDGLANAVHRLFELDLQDTAVKRSAGK